MKWKSIGFIVGIVAAFLHFCLVLLACYAIWHPRSSTAGLAMVPFLFLDAPLTFLTPFFRGLFGEIAPLIQFGILGSALWFVILWLIGSLGARIVPRWPRIASVVCLVFGIPVVYFLFGQLSIVSIRHSIERERPEELKGVLNSASSDFLSSKVVFSQEGAFSGISSISRMDCWPHDHVELQFSLPRAMVFLDKNYQEKHRISFGDRVFRTMEPVHVDEKSPCSIIATRFQKGTYLFDLDGKEIWSVTRDNAEQGPLDQVQFGDIDGDGRKEFAMFTGGGIRLLDSTGKTRWKHSTLALGHLEMADVRGNGKAEIIYCNANNADGVTTFTIVDSAGAIVSQNKMDTPSYEFALVRWPRQEAVPFLLLTEKNKFRIVDLTGKTIKQLDAPGCRAFGAVKAVTVQFKPNEPRYLAVRKKLHPDLNVLYVYNADGKLVYQKTDVIRGGLPTLAAVPAKEDDVEKLLVGACQNSILQVLEYSITHD